MMGLELFEKTTGDILSRERERVREEARAELAEWEKDMDHQTEIRALKKLLAGGKPHGRRLYRSVLEEYAANPHPLDSFLTKCRNRPFAEVSRRLDEVRRDFEQLRAWAGEGDGV
jgi:hypothetical protein